MDINALNQFATSTIQNLKSSVSGLISVSLVSLMDGTSVMGYSAKEDHSYELASALQAQIYSSARKSLELVNHASENFVDEILIRSEDRMYILTTSREARVLLGVLVLDAKAANIGMARMIFAKVRDSLKLLVDKGQLSL